MVNGIVLGCCLAVFVLSFYVYLYYECDKFWKKGYNEAINLNKTSSRIEGKIDYLIEGIGGVQSVNLSAKRYIELLKAEEELIELRLALKALGGKDDIKV